MGECGIPPLLVQRYAEELKQDLISVALVMDQVRVQQLCARRRPGVCHVNFKFTLSNI